MHSDSEPDQLFDEQIWSVLKKVTFLKFVNVTLKSDILAWINKQYLWRKMKTVMIGALVLAFALVVAQAADSPPTMSPTMQTDYDTNFIQNGNFD